MKKSSHWRDLVLGLILFIATAGAVAAQEKPAVKAAPPQEPAISDPMQKCSRSQTTVGVIGKSYKVLTVASTVDSITSFLAVSAAQRALRCAVDVLEDQGFEAESITMTIMPTSYIPRASLSTTPPMESKGSVSIIGVFRKIKRR
jgi:hypothetical protein